MKRVLVLAALSAIAGLALPALASANRWSALDVALAMRIADAHWPDSPCFAAHQIRWLRGSDLDAQFPGEDPTTTGVADIGGCRVWLAWDRIDPSPVWLCTIIEHEYGHNAGAEHSNDPHNVMNPWQATTAPDCERAFATHRPQHTTRRRANTRQAQPRATLRHAQSLP